MRFLYSFVWTFVQSFLTEEWWLLTPSRPSSCISVPRVLSFQPAVFSPFLGPIPILLNSISELRFPLISAILKQNNKKYWPTLAALFCPFIYLINYCSRNHTMSIVLCPLISAILQKKKKNNELTPTLALSVHFHNTATKTTQWAQSDSCSTALSIPRDLNYAGALELCDRFSISSARRLCVYSVCVCVCVHTCMCVC